MMDGTAMEKLKAKFGSQVELCEVPGCDPFVRVERQALRAVALFCRDDVGFQMDLLSCLSGVDHGDALEVVYHLASYQKKTILVLKVRLERGQPEVDSVEDIWRTANWHERECYDLFGVRFSNHPDLRRILLPDDWVGFPLRKDYQPPTEYHGISHQR